MAIEQTVDRDVLLERAASLVPELRRRAPETEAARQIPAETIASFTDAGLLRIPTPGRFGGYHHDIDLMFEVAMTVGTACGSSAWCYSVWSIHNWMLGFWPEEAQEEYFATGPSTLSSSSFMPGGKLAAVDGGFLLSGRWEFSSGSDGATWAMLGAMGDRGPVMALLPRSDYEIVDTWHVSGLKGTGSKDIVVENKFVPAHRLNAMFGPLTNSRAYDLHQRQSYRLPPMTLLPFTLCSPLVGMAQGAMDAFIARLEGKTGPGRTAESVALQLRLAESAAEIDSARLLVKTTTRQLIEQAARGELPSDMESARVRLKFAYVTKLVVSAVNRLFEGSGGHALFDAEPIQRFHRDVHAGSHQVALNWDTIAEGYGRAALGLPPVNGAR